MEKYIYIKVEYSSYRKGKIQEFFFSLTQGKESVWVTSWRPGSRRSLAQGKGAGSKGRGGEGEAGDTGAVATGTGVTLETPNIAVSCVCVSKSTLIETADWLYLYDGRIWSDYEIALLESLFFFHYTDLLLIKTLQVWTVEVEWVCEVRMYSDYEMSCLNHFYCHTDRPLYLKSISLNRIGPVGVLIQN